MIFRSFILDAWDKKKTGSQATPFFFFHPNHLLYDTYKAHATATATVMLAG